MKKIRILTRCQGYNFGSSLQAYALQQKLEKLGFSNLIVNYDELSCNIRWKIRPFIEDVKYLLYKYIPLLRNLKKEEYEMLHDRAIQIKQYNEFDKKYLKKTEQKLRSSKALNSELNDCYACICGSDQIWNPNLYDSNFYLSFITNQYVRKIAYAPSLGIKTESECPSNIINQIDRFDNISLREQNACDIVQKMTGRSNIPLVVDPTLLLNRNDWNAIKTDYAIDGDYILCYFLGHRNPPILFLSQLRKRVGLPLVVLQTYDHVSDFDFDKEIAGVSPTDFLSLISKAKYVCTDSFHGTIFSYIYQKDFFVFNRFKEPGKDSQNVRIDNLLNIFNLQYRLKDNNSELSISDLTKIDYGSLQIDQYKEISIDFLKKSLLE